MVIESTQTANRLAFNSTPESGEIADKLDYQTAQDPQAVQEIVDAVVADWRQYK